MLEFILIIALLGLGACFLLIAMLDAGISQAGRYSLLGVAMTAWVLTYPLMF
jgi:hypothetical protein